MFFNIKKDCNVVFGINGASVYDLSEKKMYSLKVDESKVLFSMQYGKNREELEEKYGESLVERTYDQLKLAGVIEESESFYPHEEFRNGKYKVSRLEKEYRINMCYLELPLSCKVDCEYCGKNSLLGCYSCRKPKEENKSIDLNFYKRIICELKGDGCRHFILYGGNVLEYFSVVKEIMDSIVIDSQVGIIISIENILNNEIEKYFENNKVYIVSNVNYEKMDEYTYLSKSNLLYNFNISLNKSSEALNKLQKFKDSGIKFITSFYSDELTEINYSVQFPQIQMDKNMYRIVEDINPCMFGKITIKSDKRIYPCINSNKYIGDISNNIREGLEKSYENLVMYWESAYTKRKSCSICKYGKSCIDCRSYIENFGGLIMDKNCTEILIKE